MDGCSLYLQELVTNMFHEFEKQPVHLQSRIVNALEEFIGDWKVRNQHPRSGITNQFMESNIRGKASGDGGILAPGAAATDAVLRQQDAACLSLGISSSKDEAAGAGFGSERLVAKRCYPVTVGKDLEGQSVLSIVSGVVEFFGFDGRLEDGQGCPALGEGGGGGVGEGMQELLGSTFSNADITVACKVEDEIPLQKTMFAGSGQSHQLDWAHPKCTVAGSVYDVFQDSIVASKLSKDKKPQADDMMTDCKTCRDESDEVDLANTNNEALKEGDEDVDNCEETKTVDYDKKVSSQKEQIYLHERKRKTRGKKKKVPTATLR